MKAPRLADVLRRRRFRYLFLGVTFSRVGDAMTFIVISWLALGIGGPRAVGLVLFVGGCVGPATAPVIGYLMDKLGVKLLLLADNLTRGLLMLALATFVRLGHVRLEYLLVFAVLSAVLSPATELGQSVTVPMLLPSAELDAANRLLAATWDVSAWLGPAFAGFAIATIGSPFVLLLDAATFFVMALVALRMPGRSEQPAASEAGVPGGGRAGVLSGFRLLWQLRPVMIITLVAVGDLFLGGMMEVLLPAFNKLTLHQGPSQYGLLVSAAGITCLCGTLFLTPLVTRLGYGPGLVVVLAARGLLILPLVFAGSWGFAVLITAIAAAPDGGFFPIVRTVQQHLIPAHIRGRVQGAKGALGVAGWPLGSAVGGLLVAAIGARPTAAIIGIGYLPLAAVIMFVPQLMRHSVPAADGTAMTGPVAAANGPPSPAEPVLTDAANH